MAQWKLRSPAERLLTGSSPVTGFMTNSIKCPICLIDCDLYSKDYDDLRGQLHEHYGCSKCEYHVELIEFVG